MNDRPFQAPVGRGSELAAGARDTIPMLIGAAPFGLIFGTLVTGSPLTLWQGQWMSLAIFAGSSQFIGIGLMSSGAGLLVILATTLIVNLRHALYATALLPHLQHLAPLWRGVLGFLMTDETFAVSHARLSARPGRSLAHWYMLGSGLAMYLNWQVWTAVGLLSAGAVPGIQGWGLDFAMVATFIAILLPQLRDSPTVGAALAAGVTAWLARHLPFRLGLLAAVALGIGVGLALSARQGQASTETP